MKRFSGGLAVLSMATVLSVPAMAQDFDRLMLQQSQVGTPIGLQLKVPFGGAGKQDNSMQLNFGYRMKDSSGNNFFVPVTGYNQARGGFHVLGLFDEDAAADKPWGYALGGLLLAGVAYMVIAGGDSGKDCPAGQVYDAWLELCTS